MLAHLSNHSAKSHPLIHSWPVLQVIRRLEDEQDAERIQQVHTTLQEKLPVFVQSGDLEVQERVGIHKAFTVFCFS
jgi:hypothetical protein